MKVALFTVMILSFAVIPARAMLRPSVKAFALQRDALQMFFLKSFFDATQETSKIKNVFFVTHQFDDSILSKRLQGLQQCGIPVHVLVSHVAARKSVLLDELDASGIPVKVFSQKYNGFSLELKPLHVLGSQDDDYISVQRCPVQSNRLSVLAVCGNDGLAQNNHLVIETDKFVASRVADKQFANFYKQIMNVNYEKETKSFKS